MLWAKAHEGSNPSSGTADALSTTGTSAVRTRCDGLRLEVFPDHPLTYEARTSRILVEFRQQRYRCVLAVFQRVELVRTALPLGENRPPDRQGGIQCHLKPFEVVETCRVK